MASNGGQLTKRNTLHAKMLSQTRRGSGQDKEALAESAIARALERSQEEVEGALRRLAAARVLILAPGTANIWAANPFCATPSNFRVEALGRTYWGICIWDALGIPAALHADATVTARCGDCHRDLVLEVRGDALAPVDGIVHFGVPAARWWDNIAFT